MASVVNRNNSRKFHEVAQEEVDIDGDLLEQLRESIRYNQTLKALICVELLFEKMNETDDKPGMVEPEPAKSTTKKTTAKKAEPKEDEKE